MQRIYKIKPRVVIAESRSQRVEKLEGGKLYVRQNDESFTFSDELPEPWELMIYGTFGGPIVSYEPKSSKFIMNTGIPGSKYLRGESWLDDYLPQVNVAAHSQVQKRPHSEYTVKGIFRAEPLGFFEVRKLERSIENYLLQKVRSQEVRYERTKNEEGVPMLVRALRRIRDVDL